MESSLLHVDKPIPVLTTDASELHFNRHLELQAPIGAPLDPLLRPQGGEEPHKILSLEFALLLALEQHHHGFRVIEGEVHDGLTGKLLKVSILQSQLHTHLGHPLICGFSAIGEYLEADLKNGGILLLVVACHGLPVGGEALFLVQLVVAGWSNEPVERVGWGEQDKVLLWRENGRKVKVKPLLVDCPYSGH